MQRSPLYEIMNGRTQPENTVLSRFNQFKNTFSGDPKATIQRLLDSGQITQAQYDNAVRTANQLLKFVR